MLPQYEKYILWIYTSSQWMEQFEGWIYSEIFHGYFNREVVLFTGKKFPYWPYFLSYKCIMGYIYFPLLCYCLCIHWCWLWYLYMALFSILCLDQCLPVFVFWSYILDIGVGILINYPLGAYYILLFHWKTQSPIYVQIISLELSPAYID